MKSKIRYLILFVFVFTTNLMAQPLPPTTPEGNAVPIGGLGTLLLFAVALLFFQKKNKLKQK